jgi:hypothetical protein
VSAQSADSVTARQLRVAPGAALLRREQVLHGADGVAYQYVFSRFRGDPGVLTGPAVARAGSRSGVARLNRRATRDRTDLLGGSASATGTLGL